MNGLVPQKWREVFNKVLAKKPDSRYQTASEFVRDLELCLGSWFSGLGDEAAALPTPEESTVTVPQVPGLEAEPGKSGPGEAETVVLPAASEIDDEAEASDTLALPGTTATLETPRLEDSATVQLEGETTTPTGEVETVALPAAGPLEDLVPEPTVAATPPPETTALPETTAPATTVTQGRPKSRPLPAGRLLAGAAGLFVLSAAIVGWLLWQRGTAPDPVTDPAPTPLPALADDAAPLPTAGALHVTSEPEGASVTLNGEDRGTTPLDLAELPFGVYEVRLALRGHEDQTHDVSLSAGEARAEVHATLSRRRATLGRVNFTSTPPGAEVTVGRQVVGKTPLEGVRLAPGRHRVSMALEGHAPWEGSVEVVAGRRISLAAPLEAVAEAAAPPPPEPEPVDTTRIYENKPGEVDRVAKKKSGASPSYPSERAPRLKSGERVSVTFSFVVNESGEIEDLQVLESAGQLIDDVVTTAVSKWRYEPAMIRGTPVRVRIVRKQTFLGG
jgi:TonB family protein